MDILSQYEELLSKLKSMLSDCHSIQYSKRDFDKIAVLEDEIQDIEFALREMKRKESGKRGYRPRRSTLQKRADFYLDNL